MYKYDFYIIDNENGCEYDYTGYFKNHFEADRFITENEAVGNVVYIYNNGGFDWIPLSEVPKTHL